MLTIRLEVLTLCIRQVSNILSSSFHIELLFIDIMVCIVYLTTFWQICDMTEWIRGTFHVVAVFPMSLPCLITTLLYVCAVLTIDTCLANVFALIYFYVAMFLRRLYLHILLALWPESRVHIKAVFSGMVIPVLKMRRSWESRIFNMGIPILGRRRLYIETAPR